LLAARRALPAAEKAAADAIICARILDWWQAHPVTSLGVYYPIRNEPDLLQAYNALNAQGVHLSLPNILGPDQGLEFLSWKPGEALIKDALGTSIPVDGKHTIPQALLIPCVGFNAGGFRLGYGGGFYDARWRLSRDRSRSALPMRPGRLILSVPPTTSHWI